MNVEETIEALNSCMPPQTFGAPIDGEFAACNDFLCRVKDAIYKFLNEYVELPEKEVVIEAFEGILDTLLPSLPVSALLKSVVRRAAIITAESLYDIVASKK